MTTFLDRALPLLERGFSLIPITPAGKTPIGGFGATRRSRDRAVIEDWAAQFPTANVGIVADEDICILESDDLERLHQLIDSGTGNSLVGHADTLTSCGSSTMRPHMFYRHTEKSRNVGNLAVPGLFECRFSNQYVVGPGSVHPSGSVYRWLNDEPICPIPDWLVTELVRLAMTGKKMTDRIVETHGDKVPEGSRHYFLMREAGKLWDGERSETDMFNRLDELNHSHCDPPRSASHIWQCVRDIMARDAYDPGPKVVIGGAFPNPAIFDGLTTNRPIQPEEAEAEIWTPLSADELVAKTIPPRDPVLVEGEGAILFYEQSINQILAWRGVGKTNFALGLAGALAAGARLLDFSATGPKRVLYLDGELPEAQLQERVNAFVNKEHRENLKFFSPEMRSTPQALNLLHPKDRAALDRLLDSLQPQVIFLDSQSTLMVGDSNKDDFQEKRMQLLRDLRWRGLCVIEMHHVGKSGMQRGLSKNDDVLDVQMFLKKSKDWEPEDGLEFEVVYEKVRHAAKLDSGYKVRLVDGAWKKEASDELELVAACIEKKMSYREIEKKHKISHSRVGRLVKKAHKSGRLDPAIVLKSEE